MPRLMLEAPGARVVVAGSGKYAAGSRLPEVGQVAASVRDLGRCLVERAGLDPAGLTTLIDPADPVELGTALVEAARQATDVLVFCFVGHGLVGPDNELYLATYATVDLSEGITQHQALPYSVVRQALARCGAPLVLVILDCCFSGRATPDARDTGQRVMDATLPGTYLLAAAGRDQAAWAPPGERHTAFTGALVELLTGGDPTAPGLLTLDDVYRCLARTLPERGLPAPRRQATDQGDRQLLAPNSGQVAGEFSPYRGLAAFGPEDADYFFGRTELTRVLVDRVARQAGMGGLLVVTGPSGSGKSSLLRAGLIPVLGRSPGTEVAVMTPGSDPAGVLAARFAALDGSHPADLRRRLEDDPRALAGLFAERQSVVIVDQFEEVFTACADEERRRVFIRALHALSGEAVVVVGVRADFFGHCAGHGELVPALGHPVVVGPMTPAQLREAIEGPARRAGLTLQPGLIDLILEDLGFDQAATEPRPGGAALLPLLSHALLVTWQHREGSVLTMGAYRATGGIRQALARTADATLDNLDLPGRQSARLLLTRLVRLGEGQDDTRRDMPLTELLPDSEQHEATREVLDRFVHARLLTVHSDTAQIAHEALIRAWPQLRLWIETDRGTLLIHQQLAEDAAEWLRQERDPAFLYRGTRLSAAQEASDLWRIDPGRYPALTDVTRDFLRTGRSAADRLVRRRRRSVMALVLLLVLAATGFGTTGYLAAEADGQRAQSLSRQLAAQSENIGDTDIDLARRLSATAWHIAPTAEARLSLLRTLNSPQRAVLWGHTDPVEDAVFNRDGSRLLTFGRDGGGRLWDGRTGRALAAFPSGSWQVLRPVFNADGSRLMTKSEEGAVRLWDATTAKAIAAFEHGPDQETGAAFSPDGSRLAIGGEDGTVRIVDSATGRETATLTGHHDRVTEMTFSPDGTRLATSGYDETARLWNVATGRTIATIKNALYARCAFNRDGSRLALMTDDQVLWLLDGTTGKAVAEIRHADEGGATAEFTPDGSRIVVSWSGGLELRDAVTGRLISWFGRDYPIFSPDGSRVFTATFEDPVGRLRDAATGKVLVKLEGHTGNINDVAFSPDSSRLATASEDGTVRLRDLRTGKTIVIKGHSGAVHRVEFSPDGSRLATTGADRTVRLWDGRTGERIAALTGHTGDVLDLAFSPDGSRLVTTGDDRTARVWDARTGGSAVYRGHTALVHGLAISPDASLLATVGEDGAANLWNTATGRPVALYQRRDSAAYGVTFSADGTRLATVGEIGTEQGADGDVEIADGITGKAITKLTGHNGAVKGVAFRPDGRRLATVGDDGTLRFWDPVAGRQTAVMRGYHPVLALAYRPGGRSLATGAYDGSMRLWDDATGRTIRTLGGHAGPVYGVAFSPDGSLLASAGYDGTVKLWNAATGASVAVLRGHTGPVYGVAFSPDGSLLASAGDDATVRVWDRVTGKPITILTGHNAAVYAVAFTRDGSRLLTGGADKTARLWDVRLPADPFSATCALLREPMSRQEWAQYLPDDPYQRVCLR
ncbi:caspase, EACC1-associated type [Nonomuraea insulae]|uniref:Novel STAND NTPase 1 domain-containing protein n=1 Tax=Nonomuraea insulae TaxID=1616787 RepID=A0ABW1CR32_9ACTN